eukprot:5079077-Prorocentrum_lima.AAC.1
MPKPISGPRTFGIATQTRILTKGPASCRLRTTGQEDGRKPTLTLHESAKRLTSGGDVSKKALKTN